MAHFEKLSFCSVGYLYNYLAGQKNEDCIDKQDFEAVLFKAQDSNKDIETNT